MRVVPQPYYVCDCCGKKENEHPWSAVSEAHRPYAWADFRLEGCGTKSRGVVVEAMELCGDCTSAVADAVRDIIDAAKKRNEDLGA